MITRGVRGRFISPPACRCVLLVALMIVAGLSLAQALGADSPSAPKKPFTVRDSIAWSYVLPFSSEGDRAPRVAAYSPDRAHFIVHTRHGDLARNVNVDSLLLFTTSEVHSYMHSRSTAQVAPVPTVLASFDVSRDEDSLTNIEWLGNSRIGFIARGGDGRMQAFALDISDKSLQQLTASGTHAVAFALAGSSLVYYACIPRQNQTQPVVLVDSFDEALPPFEPNDSGCYATTPVELFKAPVGGAGEERMPLPAMRVFPNLKQIWLAPAGDFAVIVAPAINAPSHWEGYKSPEETLRFTAEWVRDDATSMDLLNRTRYLLVDLHNKTIRPLLDAPTGQMAVNRTPLQAFWRSDGRSVIVTNTFLPLTEGTAAERTMRQTRPVIAEVDLVSGKITPICFETARADMKTPVPIRIVDFEWDADADRLTLVQERRADRAVLRETYVRRHGRWRKVPAGATSSDDVQVVDEQGLNERPRIYVNDGSARTHKLLFDPNPQADQFAFGKTRPVEWQDSNGLQWKGGLLLPPDFVAATRYPLVVQTHGFTPTQFLLDGPGDRRGGVTAFAAQALASAGFVVLQVEDNPRTITQDHLEGPAVAEGFRAGIERLVADGLVDGARVGLIAFSRTGYHALHLVARYPNMLSALTMSDTLHTGYSIRVYNAANAPTAAVLDRLTHGKPELERIGKWFAENPLYSLSHARAAVRLEAMVQGLGMWEAYAVLREAGRPVDFVMYPDGSHVLQKPQERLSSQGGNLDWFRFWLQGYEDPAPEKREQYERWRKLRDHGEKETDRGQSGAR